MPSQKGILKTPNASLHWRASPPAKTNRASLLWLGGFASDMAGTKALFLHKWAKKTGRHLLRFDYSAHGESEGDFSKGSIGQWLADALSVIDELAPKPLILVGSSMGAWLALLAAGVRARHVAGLFLIAPAPDFTERLIFQTLKPQEKKELLQKGFLQTRDAPQPFYAHFIKEARMHLLLNDKIKRACPVFILHGLQDEVIPKEHVLKLLEKIECPDLQCRFLKEGDHRLSSPKMLGILSQELERFCREREGKSARKPSR